MLNLEVRPVVLFGLVGALLAWALIYVAVVVIRGVLLSMAEEGGHATEQDWKAWLAFRRVWARTFWPGVLLIVLCWSWLFVWGGWKASNTPDEPQGVLGTPQGTLDFETPNSPDVAGEEIRAEGREIQKDGFRELDDWRQNFFEKRGRNDGAENEADGDAVVPAGGGAGGVRDGGSSGEESDPDARERRE